LRAKTEALGYELNDEELSILFTRFKELADRKKLLDEQDIHSLLLPHLEVAGLRQAET